MTKKIMKSMGLGKAQDLSAGLKAQAKAAMPGIAKVGRKTPVKLAVGGAAKVRHGAASPKGAPTKPHIPPAKMKMVKC